MSCNAPSSSYPPSINRGERVHTERISPSTIKFPGAEGKGDKKKRRETIARSLTTLETAEMAN